MKNTSFWAPYFIAVLTMLATTTAKAGIINLIDNGSFENVGFSNPSGSYGSNATWQLYSSIPSWDATQNIEIWSNDFIVPAYHGNNVLELNAHPGNANGVFSIFQDFATNIGQTYELTFAGHRRSANANESFSVSVGNLFDSIKNQSSGHWNEYSYQFTAVSTLSTLTFTSFDGGNDTTGNIFDDIRVTTSVPEPSTLAIFSLAIIGLVARQAKKQA
jgi:hypothetical protein